MALMVIVRGIYKFAHMYTVIILPDTNWVQNNFSGIEFN